eukprot:scaffold1870_cov73-Cyclotella_meneghiniana.AAC.10
MDNKACIKKGKANMLKRIKVAAIQSKQSNKVQPEEEKSLPRLQKNTAGLQPQNEDGGTTCSLTASLTPEVVVSLPPITQPPPRGCRDQHSHRHSRNATRVSACHCLIAPTASTRSKVGEKKRTLKQKSELLRKKPSPSEEVSKWSRWTN